MEPPLNVDEDKTGVPSDHDLVIWSSLDNFHNQKIREEKKITFRHLTHAGFKMMEAELEAIEWEIIDNEDSADDQASTFHKILFASYDRYFKQKTKIVCNESEPYFTDECSKLQRKKMREYAKHGKSAKYLSMQKQYKSKVRASKRLYYKKSIHLKESNPGQWYRQIKLLTKYDEKEDKLKVESLKHLGDDAQAEAIAEKFASIANEFQPLDRQAIHIPSFTEDQIPVISENEVKDVLEDLNTLIHCMTEEKPNV